MSPYFADHAWLPTGLADRVLISVADGRFSAVRQNVVDVPAGADRLPGIVLPGFANSHSHAFHRALRGRTHDGGGTFWTWRHAMYTLAERLDPDSYLALARAVYAEMALAGISAVGEFHYLHHQRGGRPYHDPNVMAEALRQAADEAGIRLTLLDGAYLAGGLSARGHLPLAQVQRRFSDGDADRWAERVSALKESPGMRIGAALHSVRAVPAEALPVVAAAARQGFGSGEAAPLHVHVSEQLAENVSCQAHYGASPVQLLAAAGVWGAHATAVHATHLSDDDIRTLGTSRSTACVCPTTERDLADGIGPARQLADAGTSISLGTDQNAIIDMIEEARALEMNERLASGHRGRFGPQELLTALTAHACLGWDDAGAITAGARADLVALQTDSPRTAGSLPEQVLMAAGSCDVHTVVVDGVVLVRDGRHRIGDVGQLLTQAITPLWEDA